MSKRGRTLFVVGFLLGAAGPARSQSDLPAGTGKAAIQTHCVQCHDLRQVTRAGYTAQGWRTVIQVMLEG